MAHQVGSTVALVAYSLSLVTSHAQDIRHRVWGNSLRTEAWRLGSGDVDPWLRGHDKAQQTRHSRQGKVDKVRQTRHSRRQGCERCENASAFF